MRTFHVFPDDALKPFIDRLWGWESTLDEVVLLPTVLPGTGAELYFHYRMPFRRMTEQGPQSLCDTAHLLRVRRQPIPLCSGSDVGFIAVRFRAGMLHRFTDMPGREPGLRHSDGIQQKTRMVAQYLSNLSVRTPLNTDENVHTHAK